MNGFLRPDSGWPQVRFFAYVSGWPVPPGNIGEFQRLLTTTAID
jgi:hypothetical protein